ncbi:MAG: M3 family oligoendopeptidase [Planctomycetaceae bacterium]
MPNFPLNWALDLLLPPPSGPEFQAVLDEFRGRLENLAERSENLPAFQPIDSAASAWSKFLREFEWVEGRATDLSALVACHAAADAANPRYRQLEAALAALDPLRERIGTNVELSLKAVGDANVLELVRHDKWLQDNEFFLQQRRRNAAFRLPKEQELLAADLAVDGLHAWGRLYDRISGDLRIRVMERGEMVEKSPGQVRFDSPERSVRQNNFFAAGKAWQQIADTCADALNHISGARLAVYRRLKTTDHLDMPLHRNRMQRDTLTAMWDAVTARKSRLLAYFEAKANLLGIDRLCWYDTQAPLPQSGPLGPRATIAFDEGAEMVINTFDEFSPDMGAFARHALESRWVEAENRGGKRQGAFCTGFPTAKQSRVFMTYTNTLDNVSTLAHELGHAYHGWVLKDQPLFLRDEPMSLAETASTFAEAVLAEGRLQRAGSVGEKLAILDHLLADAVVYLMNIHARFLFEDVFHRERTAGELPASRLSELMLAAQKEAYLNGLADDGWYPDFWISKLHFYISGLPFYNFPYTFGYLLSTGLFATASEDEGSFCERYRRLLVATGCMECEAAVQSTFGFDLTRPEFWNKSLDVVDRRLQQFLELAVHVRSHH